MIDLQTRGHVAVLSMRRGKGNALNLQLLDAVDEALKTIERSSARAVVITGEGSVFGAGVDLGEIISGGECYIRKFLPRLTQVIERLATYDKPTVAAVNGHAIAGGAIIVLACDQRILASGKARMGLSEIQVGVQFPVWALEVARFATPPEHFSTLILTGRTWLPEEALARGLVDELVDPEQLLERSCEVANELGAVPQATFAATKRAVRRPLLEAVDRSKANDSAAVDAWCAPETLRQIAAFAERNIKRRGEGK